jgi:hypothetical protein
MQLELFPATKMGIEMDWTLKLQLKKDERVIQ